MNEVSSFELDSAASQEQAGPSKTNNDFGRQQTRQTRFMRGAVFLFVLLATIVACFLCFFVPTKQADESFEYKYFAYADTLISTFRINLEDKVSAVDQFRISMTSYGAHDVNSSWPYVTIPDFHVRGSTTRSRASALTIDFAPIVDLEERETWEAYSLDNLDWVEQGKAYDKSRAVGLTRKLQGAEIASQIYTVVDGEKVAAKKKSSYFPIWQHSPVIEGSVNFDVASTEASSELILEVIQSNEAILGPIVAEDDSALITSHIYMPLYTELKTGIESDIAGVILLTFDWASCLQDSLLYEDVSVVAVLSNECGQTYSYRIDGAELSYLGEGDMHDSDFTYLMSASPVYDKARWDQSVAKYKGISLDESCHYTLQVYPTQEMYDTHHTFLPVVTLVILLCICIPTTCAICAYERAVSRRYEMLRHKADQANDIVTTMFPAGVQERLFNGENDPSAKEKPNSARASNGEEKMKSPFGDVTSPVGEQGGLKLDIAMAGRGAGLPKAIAADSFAATTILFGDIVG
jgi:hypothetical protein